MTRAFDFIMVLFTSAIITGLKQSNDFFQNYTKVRYSSRKFNDDDRLFILKIQILVLSLYISLFIWFPYSIYIESINRYEKKNFKYLFIYTILSIIVILYIIGISLYIRIEWTAKYITPIITEKSSLDPVLQKLIIDINSFMTINYIFNIAMIMFIFYTILQLWKEKNIFN